MTDSPTASPSPTPPDRHPDGRRKGTSPIIGAEGLKRAIAGNSSSSESVPKISGGVSGEQNSSAFRGRPRRVNSKNHRPGFELDALVDERVFGHTVAWRNSFAWRTDIIDEAGSAK